MRRILAYFDLRRKWGFAALRTLHLNRNNAVIVAGAGHSGCAAPAPFAVKPKESFVKELMLYLGNELLGKVRVESIRGKEVFSFAYTEEHLKKGG